MSACGRIPSDIGLSLRSLIDTRFEVHRLQSDQRARGLDYPGYRLANRRGQGIEFQDLRQYTEGDDIRQIDWNVTARTSEPYTRLYRQEREQITVVVVDMRPVMFNGSVCLRSVTAGHLAAGTLWQSARQGDRCAAVVIDCDEIKASRPQSGNTGVLSALEMIAQSFDKTAQRVYSNKKTHRNGPNLSDAFQFIINQKRHRGRHLFFSGFDTEDDTQFNEELLNTASVKDISAILIRDKLEGSGIPPGQYRFGYKDKTGHAVIDRASTKRITELTNEYASAKQKQLDNATIATLSVNTSVDTSDFLIQLQQFGAY